MCAKIYASAWNKALPAAKRRISTVDFAKETEGERILVAVSDGKVAAFVSIWEADWFVHLLYVSPFAQGKGLGSALVLHAQRLATHHPLSLKCQLLNTGALTFYAALGFQKTRETGEDEFGQWVRLERPSTRGAAY